MKIFKKLLPFIGLGASNIALALPCPVDALAGKYRITSSKCYSSLGSCKNKSMHPYSFDELEVLSNSNDSAKLYESKKDANGEFLQGLFHDIKRIDEYRSNDYNTSTYCLELTSNTGELFRQFGYWNATVSEVLNLKGTESLTLYQNGNKFFAIQSLGVEHKGTMLENLVFVVDLEKV